MPNRIPRHRPKKGKPQADTRREKNAAYDAKRMDEKPGRRWYHLAMWTKGLRPRAMARIPYCVRCLAGKPPRRVPTKHINHKIPHNGVWELFCDEDNLEGLCATCHNRDVQREEARERKNSNDRQLHTTGRPNVGGSDQRILDPERDESER